MKKLLLAVFVLGALLVAGVAIAIATFDADRYRPQLISQLESALGKPVKLDRIALGWHGGLAVQLQGLTIYEDAERILEPSIQVDSAQALVRLWPLLRKDVQVSSVVLVHLRIRAARDAQGRINLMGLAAVASPAAGPQQATVGETPVTFNIASLRITDGALHWTDDVLRPPVDLWLRALDVTVTNIAPGQAMDVEARGALNAEAPNLRVTGRITLPNAAQPGSVEQLTLAVERVPLEQFFSSAAPGEPQLHGQLSTTVEGAVPTFDPAQVMRSLTGSGRLMLDEPKLVNLNILRAVFERLSMLPGLVERLETRLPESYRAKLTASDTVLAPMDIAMRVEHGAVRFDDVELRTDTVTLTGTGQVGLDGTLEVRSILRMDPELSVAVIQSVNELQALTNPAGELELPVVIRGRLPRVAVAPDVQYVASKVVVTKAVDLIGDLLREETAPAEGTPQEAPATPEAGAGDLLGQFLQRALDQQ
jgi:hypothetical protein